MASTTTRRKGGAPKSLEGVMQVKTELASPINTLTGNPLTVAKADIPVATVRRRKFGTGPFDKNWLNLDCCGLFCAGITYALHIYALYCVCWILLPPWMSETNEDGVRSLTLMGHFHRTAFSFVAIMAIAAHFKAMTTDPGAVPPDAAPLEELSPLDPSSEAANGSLESPPPPRKGKRICRRCQTFKPSRAHHCSICKRCIIKMDHHCPWVNNCVGIGNHKYFLLFVFYTCLSCVYTFALVFVRFYSCMSRNGSVRSHHMTCLDRPTQLLSILGLVVEAILFGLFTSCMILDQASVVTSKMTHIDRLKGGEESGVPSLAGVIEVFGLGTRRGTDPRFRADWLSPFANVCFPKTLRDEIMGFCRPCTGGGGSNDADATPRATNTPRPVAEIV
eukprot:Nitzschia sp. Nitz4//scaffold2_size372955//342830//344085//NITZ4_000475-RA/size372955-snap-gene-0.54-mRNA-1//1//CDS//3329546934//2202//frame0